MQPALSTVAGAQVVVPCADLDAMVAFFADTLGCRVALVSPADDPAVVVLAGLGTRIRLERTAPGSTPAGPVTFVLPCDDPAACADVRAPDGVQLRFVPADPPLELPPLQPSLVVQRAADGGFHTGRAGMGYRDLVPDRQGGRFIASHIRIEDAGPVPDYVHFHQVAFQMICCVRGWVRVVYEDQGDPFVMREGDCVLQPPTIRHRVLEASAGLEVVEIGSPAVHDTHADPALELPTGRLLPDRSYGNRHTGTQRFVRHVAAHATWTVHERPGFECRDTGIAAATDGAASARIVRPATPAPAATHPTAQAHDGDLWFGFVLRGDVSLTIDGRAPTTLVTADSVVIPPGIPFSLDDPAAELELLEVTMPARRR